jgi:hypothetical protein
MGQNGARYVRRRQIFEGKTKILGQFGHWDAGAVRSQTHNHNMVKQETSYDAGGYQLGGALAGLAEQTIIMVGNPGMGKSTVLNQLCGAAVFQSGEGHHGFTIETDPTNDTFQNVLGSSVNAVLREGNSDRRAAGPVKKHAQAFPRRMMKPRKGGCKSYRADADAHLKRALQLQIEHEDIDGAEEACRAAILIDPKHADAHVALALLLQINRQDSGGAEAAFRAAIAADPTHVHAQRALRIVLEERQGPDGAEVACRAAVSAGWEAAAAQTELEEAKEASAKKAMAELEEAKEAAANKVMAELLLEENEGGAGAGAAVGGGGGKKGGGKKGKKKRK